MLRRTNTQHQDLQVCFADNNITKLDVMREPKWKIKLANIYQSDEEPEPWRLRLLTTLLDIKLNHRYDIWKLSMNILDEMITSLCIS